jgi:hypothetical protein
MSKRFPKLIRPLSGISWPIPLFSLLSLLLFVAPWTWFPKPFTLVLPLRTSRAVQLKLYYADGSGFRDDRITARYADSRSAFKTYRLPIDNTRLKALRLHIGSAVVLDVGKATLARLGGSDIPIDASTITVSSGVAKIEQHSDFTRLLTAPDCDGFDLELYKGPVSVINGRNLEGLGAGLLCLSLLGLVSAVVRQCRRAHRQTEVAPRTRRINGRTCTAVVVGLTLLLAINVLLKLNGSSSAMWRYFADGRLPDNGLLFGSAKDIRADEWMTQTPWMLSQAAMEPPFSTVNPNVGDGATALLANLPVRHWSTLFRPQFCGFFLFDVERAFSWYWNLKWYVLVVGSFLFFRIITRAHRLATVAGTALVFFAPYMQWWYSTGAALPEIVGLAFLSVWAVYFIRRARTPLAILLGSAVLLVAIQNFIYCCYPRFQIPLLYFAVLGATSILLTTRLRRAWRVLRYACFGAALGGVVAAGFLWYSEVGSTLRMTAQLEYPGKVFSRGGDFPWAQFVIPYLQFGMNEFHFPNGLVNASNAAGFVLLLPFVALLWVCRRRAWRDGFLILMACFFAAVAYFMIVGIPPTLAKYTGWSLVYSTRGILPAGIAAIACLVRLLAWPAPRRAMGLPFTLILLLVFAAGWWFCLNTVNQKYEGFVSSGIVFAAAAYFAVISLFFAGQSQALAMTLLVAPIALANAFVNPLGRGLTGFYESEMFQELRSFASQHREGRWVVVGGGRRVSYLPYLVKAAGGDVLSGIRCNPDMRLFDVLDPERKRFEVWNRFAVVSCVRSLDDQIGLTLTSGVSYTVALPFKTELLDRLDIRYILSVDAPSQENDIPGYHAVALREGLVLKVRDGM